MTQVSFSPGDNNLSKQCWLLTLNFRGVSIARFIYLELAYDIAGLLMSKNISMTIQQWNCLFVATMTQFFSDNCHKVKNQIKLLSFTVYHCVRPFLMPMQLVSYQANENQTTKSFCIKNCGII